MAYLTIYLDYVESDKRKTKFKIGRNRIIILVPIVMLLSIVTTILTERKSHQENNALETNLNSIQDSLSSTRSEIVELNNLYKPLIDIAKKKFPNETVDESVENLVNQIISLENNIKNQNSISDKFLQNEKPEIDLCKGQMEFVPFKSSDNSFQIKYVLCNKGNRIARNVKEDIRIFFCDKQLNLIKEFRPAPSYNGQIDLPTYKNIERLTGNLSFSVPLNQIKEHFVFVYLNVTYEDSILGRIEHYTTIHEWEGYENNGNTIRLARNRYYEYVLNKLVK